MSTLSTILEYVQEVPPEIKPIKDKRQDLLTDFIFILAIFGISFWFRFLAYDWFFDNFQNIFNVPVNQENWLTKLFGWQVGKSYPTEGYFDLSAYYYPYVDNYVEGWNPYSGSRVAGDSIGGYVYGPFYIFFISLGTMFWGISSHDSVMISNLAFDSLSAVMIYILAKRSTGNINAIMISSIYSFSPVVLYYFDIKLLNTPHMTFFTLVFIWCYLEHHDTWAVFFLTFAAMIKQFPLLYAMPVLMLYVRRYGWIKAIKFMFLLFFFFLAMSFPYIVISPDEYIAKFIVGGKAKTELLTLEEANAPSRAGSTPNLVYGTYFTKDTTLDHIMFDLVNSHILFIVSLFVISWFAFSAYRLLETRTVLYYRFFAAYQFIAHATIARGIFKYYTAYLMAFLILAFVPDRRPNSLNVQLGPLVKRAFNTILSPKYRAKDVTWGYWIIFSLTLISTFGLFFLCYWALSLFLHQSHVRFFWTIIIFFVFGILVMISPDKGYQEEDPKVTLSDEKTRSTVISTISKLSSKTPNPERESYPLYILHLLGGIGAVWIIISVFSNIYSIFYTDMNPLLSSLATIFFSIFLGINVSLTLRTEKYSILDYAVFIASFALLRFLVFDSYLFSRFTFFEIPIETLVSTIVSIGYASAIMYLSLVLRKMSTTSQKLQEYFQNDFDNFLKLEKEFSSQMKKYVDFLLLFLVSYSLLFVLDRAAILFFKGTIDEYPEFVTSIVVTLNSVWFLNIALDWFRKEKKHNLISFDLYTFLLDITFMLIGFWVFFKINWMILNIDRLLDPTLIFAVGIFLLGMMGYDFWTAVYRFPSRIIREYMPNIFGEKTVQSIPK